MSIVRNNLMTRKAYTPYCGNEKCQYAGRSRFNGSQFACDMCGWKSAFAADFIAEYKAKWELK